MSWGFDFDVGSVLSDVGSTLADAGSYVAETVEFSDILKVGMVGGSLYMQNKQIEEQAKLLEQQHKQATSTSKLTPESLTDEPDDSQVTTKKVDIGTDDNEDMNEDTARGSIDLDAPLPERGRSTLESAVSGLPGFKPL